MLDEPVVVLEQAVHDYYRACVARLMQRLLNPRTPERVKDAIALRGVPLLAIELRGRLPEAPGPDAHAQAETAALLEAYGVPGPETPQ